MYVPGQVPASEPRDSDSDAAADPVDPVKQLEPVDPVETIEAALVAMRRDQGRRRLQRRAEHAPWADAPSDDPTGGGWERRGRDGHPHQHRHGAHGDHGHEDHDDHGFGPGSGRAHGHGAHALAHAARFRLLDALEASERPPSVSELAASIGVDQPRASRLVQSAVDAGHVRREADPADARRTSLVLTAAGREVLASTRRDRRSAVEAALADFTDAEIAEFARLFARFVAAWPRA